MASTGGFTLGMAFDRQGRLYTCDLKHAAVFRLDPALGRAGPVRRPATARPRCESRTCRWWTPSATACTSRTATTSTRPGRRLALRPGHWRRRPLVRPAAALRQRHGALGGPRRAVRGRDVRAAGGPHPDRADGGAGEAERLPARSAGPAGRPGLGRDGRLYVCCYEPSRVCRADLTAEIEILIDDPEAHMLCHPTNGAFRGPSCSPATSGAGTSPAPRSARGGCRCRDGEVRRQSGGQEEWLRRGCRGGSQRSGA